MKPLLLLLALAAAHPVPRENHDRFITVQLRAEAPNRVAVRIDFRLEVDEFTVVHEDMKPHRDEADPASFVNKPLEYYGHFTRIYADVFARKLEVTANGQPIKLFLKSRDATLRDEKGEPLGHLRCTFVYQAEFPLLRDKENILHVQDGTYVDQEGQIHLTLAGVTGLKVIRKVVPDVELNKLHPVDRTADHDRKLRKLSVWFVPGQGEAVTPEQNRTPSTEAPPRERDHEGFLQLFRDLRQRGVGLWLLLLLFAILGAAHALTPGHGKTLVAAYLVGEQGTIWHALVLGLVTTITHTGVVLLLAAALLFLPADMASSAKGAIRTGLGLGMGLLVTCMGFWLLLQRLAGRADHVHLGGGHHHHDHDQHHHDHHAPGAALAGGERKNGASWWGIVLLGMTGGLVPCWDAIVILVTVVGTSEFWFALPALLAFSAGLAGVLVAIGILVVKLRHFAGSHWGEGRLVRSLPLVSAALITAMGIWLCYESVHHP